MTRKQALETAILLLEKEEAGKEAAEKLREVMEELPFTAWSDKTIRDTVEQFILDHGRIPTTADFKKRPLPPHTVIRHRYGVTCGEWLKRNFSSEKFQFEEKRERVSKAFVEEYLRLKPTSRKQFDRERRKTILSSSSMMKYYGVKRWRELIEVLGLPLYEKEKREVQVMVRVDMDGEHFE